MEYIVAILNGSAQVCRHMIKYETTSVVYMCKCKLLCVCVYEYVTYSYADECRSIFNTMKRADTVL